MKAERLGYKRRGAAGCCIAVKTVLDPGSERLDDVKRMQRRIQRCDRWRCYGEVGVERGNGRILLWPGNDQNRIPPARRALLEHNQIRVQVVRHGHGEKQQNEHDTNGRPFPDGTKQSALALMNPIDPPGSQHRGCDDYPDDI